MTDADVDGSHIRTLLLTFFFRHMRELIEDGYVYVAQPPLYLLRRGRKSEFILNDGVLDGKLTDWGLENTRLAVREIDDSGRAGQGERYLAGDDLRALVKVLDDVAYVQRVLQRRGIDLENFIARRENGQKALPRFRAVLRDEDHYFAEEEDFNAFRREAQEKYGELDVVDGGLSIPIAGENDQAVQLVRYELPESRLLERAIAWLERQGLAVSDYFQRREELITGELSPAKYVLLQEEGEPIELDSLANVAEGVRELGQRGTTIKRFKGLGEMNPDELWETTLDPERRQLLQVVISEEKDNAAQLEVDWREADRIFSILMGTDVEVRRGFIESNAIHVKDLDV